MSGYNIFVEYKGGYSATLDDEIKRIVGRPYLESGYAIVENLRDMTFHFERKRAAQFAMEKLREHLKTISVTIEPSF